MSFSNIARFSSSLSIVGFLVAVILSAASVGTPQVGATKFGAYTATGTVPAGAHSQCHPVVRNSQNWYIREVDVNGDPLMEGVDYTVVDDGSNKGVIILITPLATGAHVEVTGPTMEPGMHQGTLTFN